MTQPFDENNDSTIKVNDRRRFDSDGKSKDLEFETQNAEPKLENFDQESEVPPPFEEASFASLILSIAGSAQMNLGLSLNPYTQKIEKHLPQAKHAIDLLGILSDKTKGNLSFEEEQLLQVILSDLRMRYVEETKHV